MAVNTDMCGVGGIPSVSFLYLMLSDVTFTKTHLDMEMITWLMINLLVFFLMNGL